MKLKLDNRITQIEVGDVVVRQGDMCLVVQDTFKPDFQYRVVNLETNTVVNGYKDLETLEEDCRLHTKGKDLYLGLLQNE